MTDTFDSVPCAKMSEGRQSRFGDAGIMRWAEVEPEVNDWAEVVGEFAHDDAAGWLFRGQSNIKWGLDTSLQRAFKKANITSSVEGIHVENSSIGFFKDRSRLYLPATPAESDLLGWLALMQHYGAPTRLQDWTQSPFVAAYFAYREDEKADAALWAIQSYYCRNAVTPGTIGLPWDHLGIFKESESDTDAGEPEVIVQSLLATQAEHENEILREAIRGENGWPLPILPFNVDARMAAQQAAFLVSTSFDFRIDALKDKALWPKQAEPHPWEVDMAPRIGVTRLDEPHRLIKRIRLPYAWRERALHSLKRMGITEATMFPGVDGAGRATGDQIAARDIDLRDYLNIDI